MTVLETLLQSTVLFDGATGTEYQRRGMQAGKCPELLNVESPDIVLAVHRDYLDAGSNVIETNTFGGNRLRLQAHHVEDRLRSLNRAAVEIALEAARGRAVVSASVGPLGDVLEPYGSLAVEQAEDLFAEQVQVLLEAGAELIQIETMLSLDEALAALRGARRVGARDVGVTLTFDPTPQGPRTSFGETPAGVAAALTEAGASFIGANCGQGFDVMRAVAREMKATTATPILVQPNAGMPELENGVLKYSGSVDEYRAFVREMVTLGIPMIGGCCGTSPAYIAAAAVELRKH